jgi:tripartite-type tricarboxylate transporter receptor subunit TctC
MTQVRSMARLGVSALAAYVLTASPSAADPVADFYRGKTLSMVVATSPGGDYDARGRLLARHMGRHLPGQPGIIVRNMPGAVGLQAANWLATQAPRDGTVLHMIMQNMSAHQALGGHGVEFDTRRFLWIGNTTDSPNVINSWHTTGIRTIEEVKARELIVGAPGTATASVYYPKVMNALVGTKFKIVSGYPGGNDVNLAMERGEVGGRGANSWASWKSTRPQWIADNKIHILVQIGLKRHPDLADVPLLTELAANEEDRQVLAFISADTGITRAVVTTPDVPPERVAALRHAFDATMKDPEFLAEAEKAKMDISPSSGEEAQKVADSIVDTPAAVLARAKAILEAPIR